MRPAVFLIPSALSCFVAGAQPSDDRAHAGQTRVSHTEEQRCLLVSTRGPAQPAERLVSCEKKVDLRAETPITAVTTLKTPKDAYCAATYAVEYTQKDTEAGVVGVIENKDCARSSGEYKLLVRVRGETSEVKTLEFLGAWQRDDNEAVKFSGNYPIGTNVDLLNVRAVQVRCTCADAPTE